jgi:crotonobetainyl-CoA:carnitine CoA-transferase CaiB-like acyl-CoA transferase
MADGVGPLAGMRVVECGSMASAATCGMLLASWGAEVLKVERPGGDQGRDAGASRKVDADGRTFNPRFELHNRGKESICLDLAADAGRTVMRRAVDAADVFITNMRPHSLRRFELDHLTLLKSNPRLVYGQVSAYGTGHDDEDRGSFDHGAFWAHSGLAASFAGPDGVPPQPTGGMGDRTAGSNLAGAVCAALLGRERTGKGMLVSTSLFRTGVWLQGSDISDAMATGEAPPPRTRHRTPTPLLNVFEDRDGHRFWLQIMHSREGWPRLTAALADETLAAKGLSGDPAVLRERATEVVDGLDGLFGTMTLADIGARLDNAGIYWAPVRTRREVLDDPIFQASGALVARPSAVDDGLGSQVLSPPCDVGDRASSNGKVAPEPDQDRAAVMERLGFSGAEVQALQAGGAFGRRVIEVVE